MKFVNIRKSRSKNSEAALLSRNLYKEEMKRVLNISPEDAAQKMSNDRLRSERARYEDLVFLEDQLSSRKFRIGEVDEKFVKTVQDKLERQQAEVGRKRKSDKEVEVLFKKNVAMESDTEEPSDEGEDSDGNYNEEDESDDEKKSPTKSWERGSKRRKVGKENTNAYVTVRLPKNILSEDTLVTGKRFRIGNQGLTSVVGSLL